MTEEKNTDYLEGLYSRAFTYRRQKLWNLLDKDQPFAVTLPDGTIGYATVVGAKGTDLGLSLYFGAAGFAAYERLAKDYGEDNTALENHTLVVNQHGLQCTFLEKKTLDERHYDRARQYAKELGVRLSGPHSFPSFMALEPGKGPVELSDETEKIAAFERAFKAAIWLADHGDVAQAVPHVGEGAAALPLLTEAGDGNFTVSSTPRPQEKLDISIDMKAVQGLSRQVRKLRKNGQWAVKILRWLYPVARGERIERYPFILLAVQEETGEIIPIPPADDERLDATRLVFSLVAGILSFRLCPRKIEVCDGLTEAVLKDWCDEMKIRLVRTDDLPVLREAEIKLAR